MILLLKSHVSAYTRKDGTFVQAHEYKRAAAHEHDDAVEKKARSFAEYYTAGTLKGWLKSADEAQARAAARALEIIKEKKAAAAQSKFLEAGSDEADQYLEKLNRDSAKKGKAVYFHRSPEREIKEIRAGHADGKANFGGLFVLTAPIGGQQDQYGDYLHEVTVPASAKFANDDDTKRAVESGKYDEMIAAEIGSDDQGHIDAAKQVIVDGQQGSVNNEDAFSIFDADFAEANWKAQALRARIARLEGFDGIHEGDGTLVFGGKKATVKLSKVQAAKTIKQLKSGTMAKSMLVLPRWIAA